MRDRSRLGDVDNMALLERVERECQPQGQVAQPAPFSDDKREAALAAHRHACETKRALVAERRARWASLSEGDQRAVSAVEQAIAHDCR